jgi:hypothetical protein
MLNIYYFNEKGEKISHNLEVNYRSEVVALLGKDIAKKSRATTTNASVFLWISCMIVGLFWGSIGFFVGLVVGFILSAKMEEERAEQAIIYNKSKIDND